jgi:hypothetical protein
LKINRDISDLEWILLKNTLIARGFIGQCSVIKGYMKTAVNKFNASCIVHDISYTIQGTGKDRKKADFGFYKRCVKNAIHTGSAFKFMYFLAIATVWYIAVRSFGWMFFNYTEKTETLEDVLALNRKNVSTLLLKRGMKNAIYLMGVRKHFEKAKALYNYWKRWLRKNYKSLRNWKK